MKRYFDTDHLNLLGVQQELLARLSLDRVADALDAARESLEDSLKIENDEQYNAGSSTQVSIDNVVSLEEGQFLNPMTRRDVRIFISNSIPDKA